MTKQQNKLNQENRDKQKLVLLSFVSYFYKEENFELSFWEIFDNFRNEALKEIELSTVEKK